jgi:hypothetical protein
VRNGLHSGKSKIRLRCVVVVVVGVGVGVVDAEERSSLNAGVGAVVLRAASAT